MRFFGVLVLLPTLSFATSSLVHADQIERAASSSHITKMYTYKSWNGDCAPKDGVVKAVTKPQHGRITPTRVPAVIRNNRFRADDPCIGMPANGFRVSYQSDTGFHGTDTFVIEVTFGNRPPVIDTFTVTLR
jgi:hypothetical protein